MRHHRRAQAALLALLLSVSMGSIASADPSDGCVGDRQTEDPLSPPCIDADDENPGVTWPGVNGNEIRVVFYNDFNIEGDLNAPYSPADERGDQTHWYYRELTRTAKAHLRFFQRRFETYGRTVRVIAYPSGGGLGTAPGQRIGEATRMLALDPFAVVTLVENAQHVAPFLADHGVMTFGANHDVPRSVYDDNAPYVWSFLPDQETQAAWSASFICGKLRQRPARFSADPLLQNATRKFALVTFKHPQRGPHFHQNAEALRAEVSAQCGMTFDIVDDLGGNGRIPETMARYKREGITTIVCYCVAQQSELHVPQMQAAASALGYMPEWYWDHASRMDRSYWQQQFTLPTQRGFGVTYLWHQPELHAQHHYRAYRREEPDVSPNIRFSFELYHAFLQLFTAVQNAGAELTPMSVDAGLSSFARRDLTDPFLPSGGYDDGAAGRRTFIDTAMAWWWDPAGTPPGGRPAEGCFRVANRGARASWDGWTPGDDDLFTTDAPCTAPPWGIVEL